MKFYSEITKDFYDSEKALLDAEAAATATTECDMCECREECESDQCVHTKDVESKDTTETKLTRKQLAANVEKADKVLAEARANLEVANQKAEKLSKEYLKSIEDLLNPARKAVNDAQAAKYEAIREFNEEYGPYKVSYTGDKAAQEMINTIRDMNRIFKRFWF